MGLARGLDFGGQREVVGQYDPKTPIWAFLSPLSIGHRKQQYVTFVKFRYGKRMDVICFMSGENPLLEVIFGIQFVLITFQVRN